MSEKPPMPVDSRQAARHMQIVTGLVVEYALLVDDNRAFGEPMEQIAAWREARARVLGKVPGGVAEFGAAGGLGPTALLRELVEGMRAAAESHPEVARVLSMSRFWPSTWARASDAVGSERPAVSDEVRAQRREARARWARGAAVSAPAAPSDDAVMLDDLVRLFRLLAIGSPDLRAAFEGMPIWHEASEWARRRASGLIHQLPGAWNASELLPELVTGMQVAAETQPALAEALAEAGQNPGSVWSIAVRARTAIASSDVTQAGDKRHADRLRSAPGSNAPPPTSPPPASLRSSGRQPC